MDLTSNYDERVGVYLSPRTHARLNIYRRFCEVPMGTSVSQDAAVTQLLDLAGVPSASTLLADLLGSTPATEEIGASGC